MRYFLTILLALSACGDSANNSTGEEDCYFEIAVSGEVERVFFYDVTHGCGGGGREQAVGGGFGLIDTDFNLQFEIQEIGYDELGERPITIRVKENITQRQWIQEDCTTNVSKNERVEESAIGPLYRIAGTGECPDTGAIAADDTMIVIEPFRYQTKSLWDLE